jgi:TonB family protein
VKLKSLLSLLAFVVLLTSPTNVSAAAGSASPPVREKWALIIGIGQFEDSAIKPLPYGVKSARELTSIFNDPAAGHFTPGHIHLLVNDVATRYGIEHGSTDGWLFRKALPNDLIVVYIATRMVETSNHSRYLCAADSIASDIENTGVSLEPFLKNLRERTQSHRIVCILDTTLQTKTGASTNLDFSRVADSESLSQLAERTGVSLFCASESDSGAQSTIAASVTDSPLIHFLCESIQSTQGSATLHSSSLYVNKNLEEESKKGGKALPRTAMYLAPDNDLLAAIPLGLSIKNTSALEQLHFGHPVDSLALDRPDLDRMLNSHKPGNTQEIDIGQSFSQIDFDAYLNRMKQSIQTKWQPPTGFEDRSVATMFTIAKDGTIADASVVASSGNDDVDSSALAALKAASPLEPLPPGSGQSLRIKYKFNWHIRPSK